MFVVLFINFYPLMTENFVVKKIIYYFTRVLNTFILAQLQTYTFLPSFLRVCLSSPIQKYIQNQKLNCYPTVTYFDDV